jgi:hypothetical protein
VRLSAVLLDEGNHGLECLDGIGIEWVLVEEGVARAL